MPLTPLRLAILGVAVEALHILVILPILTIGTPFPEVLDVIRATLLPMSVVTAAGLILYLVIENQYRKEIDMKDLVSWIRKEIDPELETEKDDL